MLRILLPFVFTGCLWAETVKLDDFYRAEGKVLDVIEYIDSDGFAKRSYVVSIAPGGRVVVDDPLVQTNYKIGQVITFLVTRMNAGDKKLASYTIDFSGVAK